MACGRAFCPCSRKEQPKQPLTVREALAAMGRREVIVEYRYTRETVEAGHAPGTFVRDSVVVDQETWDALHALDSNAMMRCFRGCYERVQVAEYASIRTKDLVFTFKDRTGTRTPYVSAVPREPTRFDRYGRYEFRSTRMP